MTKQISEDEAKNLLRQKDWRLEHLYRIKTKEKKIKIFQFNEAQADYHTKRTHRDYNLKARQLGFSTYGLIDLLDDTIFTPHTSSGIIAHKQDKVQKLFEMVTRAFKYMPETLKPQVSYENRNEMYFPELDSKIFVTMDLRSETVNNLHVSELAFIRNAEEKMTGVLEAVPVDGKITYETTANGMSGYAYEEWENDNSEFRKHFYNWIWEPEYRIPTDKTMEDLLLEFEALAKMYELIPDLPERFELDKEQLNFYLSKVHRHRRLVVQEYPTTDLEAFIASGRNVFSKSDLDKHAPREPEERKYGDLLIWELPLRGFKYSIGVDTSEGVGADNAVISVWNAHTGEQAGEFVTNNIPPSDLVRYAIDIGNFYNKALIVPEINSSGIAFTEKIKTKYLNLYSRESFDKRTKTYERKVGWRTTGVTKPILVNNLEEAVREQDIKINSRDLLRELKTFVRTDESGHNGYGAEGSHKDDRVIAAALALQGFQQVSNFKMPKTQAEQKMEEYIQSKKSDVVRSGVASAERSAIIHRDNRRNYKIRQN